MSRRRIGARLFAAAFALVLASAASSAPPAPAQSPPATTSRTVDCGGFLLGPDPVDLIENLRASGVGCSTARAVARGSRQAGASFDARLRYRSNGFNCIGRFVEPPAGGKGDIHYRCTRPGALVTFVHN